MLRAVTANAREPAVLYTGDRFRTSDAKTAHGLVRGPSRYEITALVDATCAGEDAGLVLEGRARGIPAIYGDAANPEIPIAISELLMKALEIKREDRFANATEMRDALKAMSLVVSPAGKTKCPPKACSRRVTSMR